MAYVIYYGRNSHLPCVLSADGKRAFVTTGAPLVVSDYAKVEAETRALLRLPANTNVTYTPAQVDRVIEVMLRAENQPGEAAGTVWNPRAS